MGATFHLTRGLPCEQIKTKERKWKNSKHDLIKHPEGDDKM
jgi:hypothetical protein